MCPLTVYFGALAHSYDKYGTHAYLWEGAELLRKWLLVCGVIFLPASSAAQVTAAILISAIAWTAHSHWRPFLLKGDSRGSGADSSVFLLQHLSLGTTLTVFVAALLVKVRADESGREAGDTDGGLDAVAYLMVLLCVVFLVLAGYLSVRIFRRNVAAAKAAKRARLVASSQRTPGVAASALRTATISDDDGLSAPSTVNPMHSRRGRMHAARSSRGQQRSTPAQHDPEDARL